MKLLREIRNWLSEVWAVLFELLERLERK